MNLDNLSFEAISYGIVSLFVILTFAIALLFLFSERIYKYKFRCAVFLSHTVSVGLVFVVRAQTNDALSDMIWRVAFKIDFFLQPLIPVFAKLSHATSSHVLCPFLFFSTAGGAVYYFIGTIFDKLWNRTMA